MVSPLLIASQPPPLHAVIAVPYNIDENPLNLEDCRSKNRSQQQSHVEVSCNQLTSALRNSSCGDVAVEDEKEKERLARQEMVRFL